jgi:hypothetical protein
LEVKNISTMKRLNDQITAPAWVYLAYFFAGIGVGVSLVEFL